MEYDDYTGATPTIGRVQVGCGLHTLPPGTDKLECTKYMDAIIACHSKREKSLNIRSQGFNESVLSMGNGSRLYFGISQLLHLRKSQVQEK